MLSLYTLKTIKVETICVTELCALYTMHKWGNKTKDSVNDCMDDGSVDVGSASVCCRRPHDSAINSFPTLPSLCSLYHTLDLVAITSCFQLQRKKKQYFQQLVTKEVLPTAILCFSKFFINFWIPLKPVLRQSQRLLKVKLLMITNFCLTRIK